MLASALIKLARLTTSNNFFATDDGQPFDIMALHQMDDLIQLSIFLDHNRIACHHLFHFQSMRMHIVMGRLTRPQKGSEPTRSFALRANLATAQKISFAHDAHKFAFVIDHRQSADVVFQHQMDRMTNGRFRRDEMTRRVITSDTFMVISLAGPDCPPQGRP